MDKKIITLIGIGAVAGIAYYLYKKGAIAQQPAQPASSMPSMPSTITFYSVNDPYARFFQISSTSDFSNPEQYTVTSGTVLNNVIIDNKYIRMFNPPADYTWQLQIVRGGKTYNITLQDAQAYKFTP